MWTLEEEPFDWPYCLRRMKGICFVRSFGDNSKAKRWISSVDAAWVALEDGERSPLLTMTFCVVLANKNDHDVEVIFTGTLYDR